MEILELALFSAFDEKHICIMAENEGTFFCIVLTSARRYRFSQHSGTQYRHAVNVILVSDYDSEAPVMSFLSASLYVSKRGAY